MSLLKTNMLLSVILSWVTPFAWYADIGLVASLLIFAEIVKDSAKQLDLKQWPKAGERYASPNRGGMTP